MNRNLLLIGLMALFFGLYGCGSSAPDTSEELVKIKADLIRAREAAATANKQAADLQANMVEYEKEMKALRETYDEDHKTMEDLYKLQAETKATLLSLKDDLNTKVESLKAELGEGADTERLKAQLDSLAQLMDDSIAEEFAALDSELTAQGESIHALTNRLDSLESQIVDTDSPVDSLMDGFAEFQVQVYDELMAFEKDMKTIQQHVRAQDSSTYDILSQLVLLENKILSLTNSFNEIMNMTPAQQVQATPQTSMPSSDYQSDYTQSSHQRPRMSEEEYKKQYIDALSNYQNGNYNDAIRMFNSLINTNRNHDLADNAQYWIGECYYGEDNYQRSLVEFQKVFDFPNSNKADAAQFKIGLCYLNMGNVSQARAEFQKFLNLFPNSDYTQKAREMLSKL
ncbi:MAG: tetratricopeptide repeat protein [Candidatus Marinimicrobia bacterium]|nr:tetratricopeptide repeat protein [Candidatus Neomarinimicrobiota bacterium]MCF7839210.1 tetratricopeptide repeat protein [Candidatus Neomarinimicrobiota bacterium]MCF7903013.1 tetratricopeptide repeat protein [Candidatus Neomarinimicrobiota bacterium]